MTRQPSIFLPHGGGPCFWMEPPPPFGPQAWEKLRGYLAGVVASLPAPPKAFLVVTAHWEEEAPTVSVAPAPGMIFDYYGFPPHTYRAELQGAGRARARPSRRSADPRRRPDLSPRTASAATTTACSCRC